MDENHLVDRGQNGSIGGFTTIRVKTSRLQLHKLNQLYKLNQRRAAGHANKYLMQIGHEITPFGLKVFQRETSPLFLVKMIVLVEFYSIH